MHYSEIIITLMYVCCILVGSTSSPLFDLDDVDEIIHTVNSTGRTAEDVINSSMDKTSATSPAIVDVAKDAGESTNVSTDTVRLPDGEKCPGK